MRSEGNIRRFGWSLTLARDEEFGHRYVSGFELIEVPRFRNDIVS